MRRTMKISQGAYAVLCELKTEDGHKWPKPNEVDGTLEIAIDSDVYDRLIQKQRSLGCATPSDAILHMYRTTTFPAAPPSTGADDQC